ncbi:MBL fold metallo-hydrolase [Roseovarius sp. 2305UL8-3]|uniref:MBL fold metallo-hydrolase n=1 Tax=Roseovarius conchicola TaxID=3121636 RepID=UPI003527F448
MDDLEHAIKDVTLASWLALEDDWYATGLLDPDTRAIGEPAYHQCNWSYLISDGGESLLFDTGSGRRPIAPFVGRHTDGVVTAFPSHMHYDHLGGINDFGPVMLADLPMLRALETEGWITPPEEMFLGSYENLPAPTFPVGQWSAPGEVIPVGTRRLEMLHTPGHSPESISLWEPARARLYAADFIYPGELYAQVPGASLPDYVRTLLSLLKTLPKDVQIVCAHGHEEKGVYDMPALGYGDLEDVLHTCEALLATAPHTGERRVNDRMELLYSAESFSA